MRTSWLRGVLVLALVLMPAKAPKPAFSGNVCGTVPANVVAAIPGVSPHCTNAQPVPGPGSTDYVGNWTGAPRLPGLQVTVASYTDKGLLELARHNLEQGLPGPPSPIKGLGGPAYEAKGAMAVGIHIAKGDYIAYITLTAVQSPPKSPKVLEPLAIALAKKL